MNKITMNNIRARVRAYEQYAKSILLVKATASSLDDPLLTHSLLTTPERARKND